MSCSFCDIVAGKNPANIVFESEHCLAFTPLEMEVDGHLLVIPKQHASHLLDAPTTLLADVMAFVKYVCSEVSSQYGFTGFNILNATGVSAQQSIDHLHFHILPRRAGDGIDAWPDLGKGNNIYAR
jgi:histidine triad (HIT) family protein